jgi:hypothetical protein
VSSFPLLDFYIEDKLNSLYGAKYLHVLSETKTENQQFNNINKSSYLSLLPKEVLGLIASFGVITLNKVEKDRMEYSGCIGARVLQQLPEFQQLFIDNSQ